MEITNSISDDFLPWWQGPWDALAARRAQGRLPHALLLAGPAGLGKLRFAVTFAQSLLCETPAAQGLACGVCKACQLLRAGSHPDFVAVTPAEAGKGILVDQIRALGAGLALKSHGAYKAAVLAPAEAMNPSAANSLLKTLEEPSDNTILILVSEQPARLPATVRSRCQLLRFVVPSREQALPWLTARLGADAAGRLLDLAAGCPLTALALGEEGVLARRDANFQAFAAVHRGTRDPLEVAAEWGKDPNLGGLEWLDGWLGDMIRLQVDPGGNALRSTDLRAELAALAADFAPRELHELLARTWEARRLAATPVNRQLLLEDLLIPWARGATRPRPTTGAVLTP